MKTNTLRSLLASACATALLSWSLVAIAQQHEDAGHQDHADHAAGAEPADPHADHAHHAQHGGAVDDGTVHATDAPLRDGMGRIRAATADALHADQHGGLAATDATALATAIRNDVNFLIANCKLDPAADQRLHGIIGELLGAAATLERGGSNGEALDVLVAALADYGRAFDHPGWLALSRQP